MFTSRVLFMWTLLCKDFRFPKRKSESNISKVKYIYKHDPGNQPQLTSIRFYRVSLFDSDSAIHQRNLWSLLLLVCPSSKTDDDRRHAAEVSRDQFTKAGCYLLARESREYRFSNQCIFCEPVVPILGVPELW